MPPLDPYQRPPASIRNVYKKYQKMKAKDLDQDADIVDLPKSTRDAQRDKVRLVEEWDDQQLTATFRAFAGIDTAYTSRGRIPVYGHKDMPGLLIIPNLLPPEIEPILLSRLLHRDLSNPEHLTNIHAHYNISYPPSGSSFFSHSPTSTHVVAQPIDPSVHRPLVSRQLLNKKMRWTTLGGQYDWTAKRYPDSPPPAFPPDIKRLLEGLFTNTKAEAAIVNLYSPGDTLSVHRDVAESSSTGLISISLGCDAIFVIGSSSTSNVEEGGNPYTPEERIVTLRLRSGSAVYMDGDSRFAWHGVPQIVAGTCPDYLKNWPAGAEGDEAGAEGDEAGAEGDEEGIFEEWRGWMAGKRVNLNVRQMGD